MRDARPIYSFPAPKEPEKKSSWDTRPAEPRVEMRDVEAERAKKRTELIRSRMSPPGALKLPPLLEANRIKYDIPDGAFKTQAVFDRIHVFPIDAFDGAEAETVMGTHIIKPMSAKMRDLQEGHRGVLISAGLTAADRLMSHGIEIGHIVTTNKNVPFARRCEQLETFDVFYLLMRDADLGSSETLATELREGDKRIVDCGGDDGYQHQIEGRKKQSVYIQDSW